MQEVFEKIIDKLQNLQKDKYVFTPIVCYALDKAIEIIRQTAAEYNNGWIPCSPDTMPNDREDVLILWGGGNRSTAYYVSGGAGGWFFNYGFDYKWSHRVPYEPYAWQPLPKQYQNNK